MSRYEQSKNEKTQVFILKTINATFHVNNLRDATFYTNPN